MTIMEGKNTYFARLFQRPTFLMLPTAAQETYELLYKFIFAPV